MLVYEKGTGEDRHLYGTEGNIPTADDVRLTYKDSEGTEISDLTFTETYLDDGHGGIIRAADSEEVDVFIGDFRVIPAGEVVSIEVTTDPTTTTYSIGDTLDLTGMVVTATYADDTTSEITGYTTVPEDGAELTAEDTTVTVSYKGFSDTVTITVS